MQNIREYSSNTAVFISPDLVKKARKIHVHRPGMSLDEYLEILKKMSKEQLTIEVESERFDKIMTDPGNKEGYIMRYYLEVYQPLLLN